MMGKIIDRLFIGGIVWFFIIMLQELDQYIYNQIGVDTWQQITLLIMYVIVLVYTTGLICEKIYNFNKN